MSANTAILIVEDDREIGSLLRDMLTREGFDARLARSGRDLDDSLARDGIPGLVVLDLMLPGEDGLSICRRLQANHQRLPVLMLTAKREDIDRIIGLELGADDYMGKPFNPRELVARIRAILRRASPAPEQDAQDHEVLQFAGFTFEPGTRRLRRSDGQEVELHSGEFELLSTLVEHPQRVLSRDQLLDWTRGRNWEAFDRSVDVAISRLRRKIEPDPVRPTLIKTVRNGGYLFTPIVERCKG